MYDPSPARFLSKDPLAFDAGDPNLYRYVFNSPTNYTDPTGLLVEGVFDLDRGTIYLRDTDTGETVSFDGYFSGAGHSRNNPNAEGQQDLGPLPRGTYEILYHPYKGFYRLDLKDDSPRNDRVDRGVGQGRHSFRLHRPGGSIGCITSDKNAEESQENWEKVVEFLEKTRKERVKDNVTSRNPFLSTIKFGEIKVVGSWPRRDTTNY